MSYAMTVELKCLDQWFEAGKYERCIELVERLLEAEPHDSLMSEYLLEALHQLNGRVASQQQAQQTIRSFEQQGLPTPDDVLKFTPPSKLN